MAIGKLKALLSKKRLRPTPEELLFIALGEIYEQIQGLRNEIQKLAKEKNASA